jgi:hypothetical protein
MQPIKTDATNKILGAPPEWNVARHGPCIGLPVVETEDPYFFSYWRASWRERWAILFGRPVRLCVVGSVHPPVSLDTKRH